MSTEREEVRTCSHFGQMLLNTGKKNLAKIVNELLKTECMLAKAECR